MRFILSDKVLDFLQDNPKDYFTARYISDRISVSSMSVVGCMVKLRKKNKVYYKKKLVISRSESAVMVYHYKHKGNGKNK